MKLQEIYYKTPFKTVKHSSYFDVYDKVLSRFINKEITVVEVGILGGGSLFMWREFFGPKARIIGIDLNDKASIMQKDGFEIFIGDQAKEEFWRDFYDKVGKIDVLIDDGGHKFNQQISTVNCTIDNINDDGVIIIEDTHTSYFKSFYPTKNNNFVMWAHSLTHGINYRFGDFNFKQPELKIHSIEFFESIIVFKINQRLSCISSSTSNNKKPYFPNPVDFRHVEPKKLKTNIVFTRLYKFRILKPIGRILFKTVSSLQRRFKNLAEKKEYTNKQYVFKKFKK